MYDCPVCRVEKVNLETLGNKDAQENQDGKETQEKRAGLVIMERKETWDP